MAELEDTVGGQRQPCGVCVHSIQLATQKGLPDLGYALRGEVLGNDSAPISLSSKGIPPPCVPERYQLEHCLLQCLFPQTPSL